MGRNNQKTKTCISNVFTFCDETYLSLREPECPMFPLSLSTFLNSPLWILYPYGDHVADAGTFLKDNILLQVKRDALGKKPYPHPPRQTNRHEQVSAPSQRLHTIVLFVILSSAPLHRRRKNSRGIKTAHDRGM